MVNLPDNIKFLLVGDGPEEKMLKNLAKELNIENRVIFVGRVDRTEVSKYRQISDIFVCPSRSEGLGNAFLSAMASRLPVIATQEGGLAEFISDETAWVVEKDKPEQITQAIKDILANPEKVNKITATSHNMVTNKYNWDLVAENMQKNIFEKLWKQA
jgi:glycosyltransferase involved in cell wall biosynthesis